MDAFLIRDGVVINIVVVESVEQAQVLYAGFTAVERTPINEHINIGEAAP